MGGGGWLDQLKIGPAQPNWAGAWAELGKIAIFQPKMAHNSQTSQFYNIDPIWLWLNSIQLIGMCLFLYIKELGDDLLTKNGPKMAHNGQTSLFLEALASLEMVMSVTESESLRVCHTFRFW